MEAPQAHQQKVSKRKKIVLKTKENTVGENSESSTIAGTSDRLAADAVPTDNGEEQREKEPSLSNDGEGCINEEHKLELQMEENNEPNASSNREGGSAEAGGGEEGDGEEFITEDEIGKDKNTEEEKEETKEEEEDNINETNEQEEQCLESEGTNKERDQEETTCSSQEYTSEGTGAGGGDNPIINEIMNNEPATDGTVAMVTTTTPSTAASSSLSPVRKDTGGERERSPLLSDCLTSPLPIPLETLPLSGMTDSSLQQEEENQEEEENSKEEENPDEEDNSEEEENPKEEENTKEEENSKEEENTKEEETSKEEENPKEEVDMVVDGVVASVAGSSLSSTITEETPSSALQSEGKNIVNLYLISLVF